MATVVDLGVSAAADTNNTTIAAAAAAAPTTTTTTTISTTSTTPTSSEGTPMQQGFVKLVQSGDTLLLQHPSRPIERSLALAYITTPRLARKSTDGPDEPFAFEAREFVRKRCCGGKRALVQFQVNYIIPQTKREFGTIWINNENLNLALVQAGLAKVKELRNNSPEFHKDLWDAAQAAQAAGKGVWTQQDKSIKAALRNVKWEDSYEAEKVYNDWKGKPKKAIVEFVLNATTLRLTILPSFHSVTLQFSGIQLLKTEGKKEETDPKLSAKQIQAINAQAKSFTESKLLMRDVFVAFEGVDKYGNLQGSVLLTETSQNVFQEELLAQGFAKVMDFSIAKTKFAPRLRAAETLAKEKQIRIFAGYVPPESHKKSDDFKGQLSGQVIEVISGDMIVILDKDTNTEVKIGFSSVRTPRCQMGRKGGDETKSQTEPFGYDAKEFVRKSLIGRTVSVKIDYTREMKSATADNNNSSRPKTAQAEGDAVVEEKQQAAEEPASAEKRLFGTVFVQEKNINLELVKEGLATVVRHRANEPKSAFIDVLYAAENEAKDARKGLHGNADKATHLRLNDLTLAATPKQSQQYFMFFQNKGRVRATVEKVFTGSRYKLIVPSTSIVLSFALQGIAAPSFNKHKRGSQPEPFAQESLDFVRRSILQRDVDVEFNSVDKTGTYVGFLFTGKKNLALEMLEHGFARPQLAVLEKVKYAADLRTAFEKAKANKRGVWSVEAPRWNHPTEYPADAEAGGEGEYEELAGDDEDDDEI